MAVIENQSGKSKKLEVGKKAGNDTSQNFSVTTQLDKIFDYFKNIPKYIKSYINKIKSFKLKNLKPNITKSNILNDRNIIKFRSWDNLFKIHFLYRLSDYSILIEKPDFDEALKIAISYFKVKKKQNLIWKKVYYIFPHKDLKVDGYKFFYHEDDEKVIKYITDQSANNNFLNYDIKVDRSGVYLKLISELYNRNITMRLLKNKLSELEIASDSALPNRILENKREWVKVADRKDNFSRDAQVIVSVTKDALKAYISKTKPESFGREVDEMDVKEALRKSRVEYGINPERIKQFINEPIYDYPVLVASSSEEMEGYLNIYEETYRQHLGKEGESYRENLFFKVEEDGYILKRKKPKKKTEQTYNVYGKIVDIKKTQTRSVNAGENTYFDEEENLRAGIAGTLVKLDNTFHVYEVLTLESVNAKTGDINHDGSIEVEKDIEDGFLVKATGSIHVCGNVGASTLEVEGNIIIDNGVTGSNKAVLKSKGSIYANFIQNASIHCQEQLIIKTLLSSSKAWVGDSIVAEKPKGTIMGGEFNVYKQVSAQHLGSIAGWRTFFYLGTPIEDLYRIDGLRTRIDELKNEIEEKKKDFANAPQYRIQNREKLQSEILNDKNKLEEYLNELKQFEKNKLLVNEESKVTVHGNIHPGVHVYINNVGFENKYLRSQVEFSVKGKTKKNIFMKKI